MSRLSFILSLCFLTVGLALRSTDVYAQTDQKQDAPEKAAEEQAADGPEDDTEEKAQEKKNGEEQDESAGDPNPDAEPANEKQDEATDAKETSKEPQQEAKDGSEPHKVERKPIKIEVQLDGVFVASEMQQVALRPKIWSKFKVLEAVEHGARVKKGDVLVRFDDEKIEEELANEMLDQQLGELAMMREEEEFPRVKKRLELSYEEAKRNHEKLLEDFQHYKNTDRPFMVKIANYRYQEAKENLASQREELEQLEKMYEADELTEETEAIVLRRQQFEVETAELILKLQTANRDHTLNVQLPRNDEFFETALEESQLALQQAKTAKEVGITRGRYELEKKRASRARSIERHSKLVSDKALMVLRAPTDGTVYYGRCVNGKWAEVASYRSKLKPFGTVMPNKVLMTIVKQRPLYVLTSLREKELPDFKSGLSAVIVPAADDDLEMPGKVAEIASIPEGDKKFTMQLEVDTEDAPQWLVAGMTCKAKVTVYENKTALVIPTHLVQTDEDDVKIKYVMLVDQQQDEPVRRNIKLGRRKGKIVEVLEGLDEGDEIVKKEKDE